MYRSFFLFLSFALIPTSAGAAGVRVLFDPSKPEVGPFPADFLTAPATNTKTARMVRMPAPADCNANPNACQEAFLASGFDGFNPQGRVRVRFSAPINPATIQAGIQFIAQDNLAPEEVAIHNPGDVISLNEIVFDPATNTAYGKPDGPMDQHRRYLLVVTDGVKDTAGDPVEVDPAFTACASDTATGDYCIALNAALKNTVISGKVVAASLYSTMSVTAWMEKARDQLFENAPAYTSIGFFPLQSVAGVTWHQQVGVSNGQFNDVSIPSELLQQGVRAVALGAYPSPDYLGAGRVITPTASADRLPPLPDSVSIPYVVYLPQNDKPLAGYPVVIYGHGLGDSSLGGPAIVGLNLARSGFATIAINAVGHGFGPNSTLQASVRTPSGDVQTIQIPFPGRGVDINGDGRIDSSEGCAAVPSSPLGLRDCLRQTAVDLMQLVRVIRAGIDLDGDGTPDLDPRNIFYIGQSLGTMYGTLLLAVDPDVQSGALNSGGGSVETILRWSKTFHPLAVQTLALRKPSLLNAGADYNEDYVLRNQPPKTVTTPGAIDIQNTFEMLDWLQAEGDPSLFASHIKLAPLPGVSAKKALWLFATGDETIPNNAESTLVRNAGMQDSLWVYQHDLAYRVGGLPADPHEYVTGYVGPSLNFNLTAQPIARATVAQITQFFQTGEIVDPNGLDTFIPLFFGRVFEQPASLPEALNYLEP